MLRQSLVITAGSCGIAALTAGLTPAVAAQVTPAAQAATGAGRAILGGPAAQAPTPGWRIVGVGNDGGHGSLTAVTAVSPADAWAGGLVSNPGTHAFLQHWDGRTWTRASLPPAVRKISLAQVSDLAAS